MRLTRSLVWTFLLLAPVLPAQAYTPFGDGCAGSAGVPVLIAEPGPMGMPPGSLPRINKTFTLEIRNLPSSPAGIVFVIVGFSNTAWAGIPLPADLSQFGLLGCTLHVSVAAVLPAMRTAIGSTRAKLSIEIANDLTLVGQRFYNQGLVIETGANPFGAVVTNAAEGIIGPENKQIIEDFADETDMDRDHSSGTWGISTDPDGEGVFGPIGGDGSQGEFSLSYLQAVASEMVDGVRFAVFEMNTEQTVIPGNRTTSGDNEVVTDGVFNFSKFMLPRGTMLRIVGRHAPQFHVRGTVDVRGIINLRGEDLPSSSDSPSIAETNETGQPGGKGGAGGGDGGAGGDKPDGLGIQARFNGQGGGSGSVVAGHAYASTAENTGGKGSRMHPADGLRASVQFNPFQTGMVAAGGGGGGHISPGANGVALKTLPGLPSNLGPEGLGGTGFPALVPAPPGSLSHEHFLIGGGGGGGGGGHPLFAFRTVRWKSGSGGAGGGGAVLLTAGHRLALGLDGQILASGGSGGVYITTVGFPPPSPGGGGAGGAIVLQSANTGKDADGTRFVDLAGFMDVQGGAGGIGRMTGTPTSPVIVDLVGGAGSHGLIRLETPLPHPGLGRVEPPAGPYRSGELVDIDPRVGFQSRWLDTGEFFPPEFLYYFLQAEIEGVPVTYSDDPTRFPGTRLAGPGEPLVLRVQGAILDLFTGKPDPQTIRPWRLFVGTQGTSSGQLGLIDDAPTGFRFQIVLDRTVMGSAVKVVVKKLTIAF